MANGTTDLEFRSLITEVKKTNDLLTKQSKDSESPEGVVGILANSLKQNAAEIIHDRAIQKQDEKHRLKMQVRDEKHETKLSKDLEASRAKQTKALTAADTGARETERFRDSFRMVKNTNQLLNKISGQLGKMIPKPFRVAGKTIMGLIKGTIFAAMLVALLIFLESDTWQETKAFIVGPLTTGLTWLHDNILVPIGNTFKRLISLFDDDSMENFENLANWDTLITIGALLLLLTPSIMFAGLIKFIPMLVAAFAALGKYLGRLLFDVKAAIPKEKTPFRPRKPPGKEMPYREKAPGRPMPKGVGQTEGARRPPPGEPTRPPWRGGPERPPASQEKPPAKAPTGFRPAGEPYKPAPKLAPPTLWGKVGSVARFAGGAAIKAVKGAPRVAWKGMGGLLRFGLTGELASAFRGGRTFGGGALGASSTAPNVRPFGLSGFEDVRNKWVMAGIKFVNTPAGKIFKILLNGLRIFAWPAYAALTSYQAYMILGMPESGPDSMSKDQKAVALGRIFGGLIGAVGGGALGTMYGAMLGKSLGAGGLIGGFLGGIAGGFAGHFAGEFLGEQLVRLALHGGEFTSMNEKFRTDMFDASKLAPLEDAGLGVMGMGFAPMRYFGEQLASSGLTLAAAKQKMVRRRFGIKGVARRFLKSLPENHRMRKKYAPLFKSDVSPVKFNKLAKELQGDIKTIGPAAAPKLLEQLGIVQSEFEKMPEGRPVDSGPAHFSVLDDVGPRHSRAMWLKGIGMPVGNQFVPHGPGGGGPLLINEATIAANTVNITPVSSSGNNAPVVINAPVNYGSGFMAGASMPGSNYRGPAFTITNSNFAGQLASWRFAP